MTEHNWRLDTSSLRSRIPHRSRLAGSVGNLEYNYNIVAIYTSHPTQTHNDNSTQVIITNNKFLVQFVRCPLRIVWTGWYLRQKPVGGGEGEAGGLPHPFLPPLPLSIPPTFQTNQWEGRSDPVRGKFPGFLPPTNTKHFPPQHKSAQWPIHLWHVTPRTDGRCAITH